MITGFFALRSAPTARANSFSSGRMRRGSPQRLGEEAFGIVIGFRLHVLAERQSHRSAFGGIGQHRHGAIEGRNQLLGPRDAVEIARHRAEAVIGGRRAVAEILDLLEDGIGLAVGEDVAGQEAAPAGGRHGRRRPPSPC